VKSIKIRRNWYMWNERYNDDDSLSFGERMYRKAKRNENDLQWRVVFSFAVFCYILGLALR
jgi:3-phenylpropionate/cinnamic acid dioxygenase small subunit